MFTEIREWNQRFRQRRKGSSQFVGGDGNLIGIHHAAVRKNSDFNTSYRGAA